MDRKLPPALELFYELGNPRNLQIPWTAEHLELFSASELGDAQEGYRYPVGQPQNPEPTWMSHWLVIGSKSGNPVIADLNTSGTPILMDFHGSGGWSPRQICGSLEDFLRLLVGWLKMWESRGGELLDDDFVMLDEVVADIRGNVAAHLSDAEKDALMSFLE